MARRRISSGRQALAALGLLLGSQLLMGDAIAPGCCASSHENLCAAHEAIALTFEVSGDCSTPGTIQIIGAVGSCQLTVEGQPEWRWGYREPGSAIASGHWEIARTADGYSCPISVSASVPGEYSVTCHGPDAAICTSVLRPVP